MLLTRRKYIFYEQVRKVDVVTFTKRSLFRKENLPCISSPATETFAKRDLFFGLCEAETVLTCVCREFMT